jgi:hypothetical protein
MIAITLLVFPAPARAGGVVTTCDEASLRAALAGGGTVTFGCVFPYFIPLSSEILITATTTIDGSNLGNTIAIQGLGTAMAPSRIFSITDGISLTLTNLTLVGADIYEMNGNGGCLDANGALVLNNVEVFACRVGTSYRGGALYVAPWGRAELDNSNVHDNSAGDAGGAVFSSGLLRINNSYFAHNSITTTNGGGISSFGYTRIAGSTIYSNTTQNGSGGGIYSEGTLSLTNTTLSSNFAKGGGGGIQTNLGAAALENVMVISNSVPGSGTFGGGLNNHAAVTLTNVTLSGNLAPNGAGMHNEGIAILTNVTLGGNQADSGNGGGIYNLGDMSLLNVTISGNKADSGYGGGIYNWSDSTALMNVTLSGNSAKSAGGGGIYDLSILSTLINTILANSPSGGNCNSLSSGFFSLSSDNTCGFGGGRDNVNVMLGPLANNGGATLTHMLLPGSPAIDFGTDAGCPSTDQRGAHRPIGTQCDVGAVEAGYLFLPLILR